MQHQRQEGTAFASSSGIVVGHVQRLSGSRKSIPERQLSEEMVEKEQLRLAKAVQAALQELDAEYAHLARLENQNSALILEAHRMLLLDPELVDKAERLIAADCINAEWALRRQMDLIQQVFDEIEDEYLRSKKSDVEQVGSRIMGHLMGHVFEPGIAMGDEPAIFIAEDFSPAEIISLWRLGAGGFICEQGGVNAHSIIIARGVGLPALIGANGILDHVVDGDLLVLDAERELWTVNPSSIELEQYGRFMAEMDVVRNDLRQFAGKESRSSNGHRMRLMANLEFQEELEVTLELGAEGVGLFRTEFIFMQDSKPPSELRQYQQYAQVVDAMKGEPVTFRLLDIGGDKPVLFNQLSGDDYNGENPAMGLRGVRMLLQWPAILKTQIRAILRASEHGKVKILVPMVTVCEEMLQVREVVAACCDELEMKNDVEIGSMIEVPGAALIADELAKVSDFFSIGTNDLIQYTLAADRGDKQVCNIYSERHPAILSLIRHTAQAAHQQNIQVSVCGELAANPEWTEAFLNMGMYALSMNPNSILMIRRDLSKLEYVADF